MTEHLDIDTLADVLAGGPAPEHLESCAACREKLARLEAALPAVTHSLGALAVPPPEPTDLADRLTRALAAELPPHGATVVPLTSRRRTRWLPALAAVAAAVAVALGGVLVAQRTGGSDADGQGPTFALSTTGTDYARDGKALRAALPGLLSGQQREAAPEAAAADSGARSAGTPLTLSAPEPSPDPLAALRTDAGLAACLVALTDPNDPEAGLPLALDYASFEGKPALVVVLPTSKPDKVDVFVVGPGCNEADAKLLFFTRLAKP